MNLRKYVTIKSTMSKESIWKRLYNVTEPYSERNAPSLFEGSIDENSFRLYQLFNYGIGNLIRPEINGKLVQNNEYVELNLIFKLSTEMRILFGAAFIISAALISIQATTNWLKDCAMFPFGWEVDAGVVFVGYLIVMSTFYTKVKECTEKLLALSKGKIVQ